MDRGSYIVLNPKDPRLEIYVTAYDGIMSFYILKREIYVAVYDGTFLYFETR